MAYGGYKGLFKRSKLFFQTKKKSAPKSLKLNLFILKDATRASKLSTHARIVVAKDMSRPEQSQYSTIVILVYDNKCHRNTTIHWEQ